MGIVKEVWNSLPNFAPMSQDIVVFEFGHQTVYLLWRCACFLLFGVLVGTLPESESPPTSPPRPPEWAMMHGWMTLCLLAGMALETLVLTYTWLCFPEWRLKMPELAPSLWVVWCQYKILHPNIFSCTIMYALFSVDPFDITQKRWLQYLVTFNAAVHVMTTAIPTCMCHFLGCVTLNVAYLLFMVIWYAIVSQFPSSSSAGGATAPNSGDAPGTATTTIDNPLTIPHNSTGSNANQTIFNPLFGPSLPSLPLIPNLPHWPPQLYPDMSYELDNIWFPLGMSLSWVLLTLTCHLAMSVVAWGRRSFYYKFREFQPQTQTTPREFSPIGSRSQSYQTIPVALNPSHSHSYT